MFEDCDPIELKACLLESLQRSEEDIMNWRAFRSEVSSNAERLQEATPSDPTPILPFNPSGPSSSAQAETSNESTSSEFVDVETVDQVRGPLDHTSLDRKTNKQLLADPEFLLMVGRIIAPFAHRLKSYKKGGVVKNRAVWDDIEDAFFESYPAFVARQDFRPVIRGVWRRCKDLAAKGGLSGIYEEIKNVVLGCLKNSSAEDTSTRPEGSAVTEANKENQSAQEDRAHAEIIESAAQSPFSAFFASSRHSSPADQRTGTMSDSFRVAANKLSRDPRIIMIVCKTVAPIAAAGQKKRKNRDSACKIQWNQVYRQILCENPELRQTEGFSKELVHRIYWRIYHQAVLQKPGVRLTQAHKLLQKVLKIEKPSSHPTPQSSEAKKRSENVSPRGRGTCRLQPQYVSNQKEPQTPSSKTPKMEENDDDDIIFIDEIPGTPSTSKPSKGTPATPRSLPFSTMIKVLDVCKQKNYGFELDGDDLIFQDLDNPRNKFRFPIDRLDLAL